jgi:hypothetical protein
MHEFGFTVFTLDDDTLSAILEYLQASKDFFKLPASVYCIYNSKASEDKERLSENETMKKKNEGSASRVTGTNVEGYLLVEGVKEYLKVENFVQP